MDYDTKFKSKDVPNFNTKLKNTMHNSTEGSEFKVAVFNQLKNIEHVLNQPNRSVPLT